VDPQLFPPPKGSGARGRLISQVTGQKAAAPVTKALRLPPFLFGSGRLRRLEQPRIQERFLEDRPAFQLHQELARDLDFGGWDCRCSTAPDRRHHAVAAPPAFRRVAQCGWTAWRARARVAAAAAWRTDVAKLKRPARRLQLHADERGGVIDDTIVYYLSDSWFRAVVNAARATRISLDCRHAPASGVEATERTDLACSRSGPEEAKAAQLLSGADAGAALGCPVRGREMALFVAARLQREEDSRS